LPSLKRTHVYEAWRTLSLNLRAELFCIIISYSIKIRDYSPQRINFALLSPFQGKIMRTKLSTITLGITTLAIIAAVGSIGWGQQIAFAQGVELPEIDDDVFDDLDDAVDVISQLCDFDPERIQCQQQAATLAALADRLCEFVRGEPC
jgi:hypothetical protein